MPPVLKLLSCFGVSCVSCVPDPCGMYSRGLLLMPGLVDFIAFGIFTETVGGFVNGGSLGGGCDMG